MTKKNSETVEKLEMKPCKVEGCENDRLVLTKRKTGKQYLWTYCRQHENERQKINRQRRNAKKTDIAEIGLNNAPVAAIKKAGIETVGDLLQYEGDLSELKGVSKKSVEKIDSFLVAFELK